MLVDLDMQNGDAALQLDSSPSHALREAFEKPDRVDKLFLERGTIHASQRLDVLASLEPLGENIPLNEDAVLSLFEKLLHRYRFIFVDLPATAAVGLTPGAAPAKHLCVGQQRQSSVGARIGALARMDRT